MAMQKKLNMMSVLQKTKNNKQENCFIIKTTNMLQKQL